MLPETEGIYQRMAQEFAVRERKNVYGVAAVIFGIGFFLLMAEILYHTGPSIPVWVYFIVLAIFLSAFACVLSVSNRRVEVKAGELCYVNSLRRKRYFSLNDVGYVKAAANAQRGQDYFHIYDKTGKILCRLTFYMENAFLLLRYLYDNGITVDTGKNPGYQLSRILMQERIAKEDIVRLAEEACLKAGSLILEWQKKNAKLGADFLYGLAEYHGERFLPQGQLQPPDSRCSLEECKELPGDYLCMLEIYLQKDGCFVTDKKGDLLLMTFPVIYRQKSGAQGESYQICYNKYFAEEMSVELNLLARYLPGNRFSQEELNLGYELKKKLGGDGK